MEKAKEVKSVEALESEMDRMNTMLEIRNKQKDRIWKAYVMTGDEIQFK